MNKRSRAEPFDMPQTVILRACARRRAVILAATFVSLTVFGCSKKPAPAEADTPQATADAALQKAVDFLISQQSDDDGNWYSDVYGKFNKANQSVAPTALVVYALAHLPENLRTPHESLIRKELDRLRSQITERGFVGDVHGAAHYPTYTTAMVLATYDRLGWDLPKDDQQAMIHYIESAQLNHTRGWTAEDGHFGGWDLVGDQVIERQVHGPGTNISVTSFALEGLATAIDEVSPSTELTAIYWLSRLQDQSTGGGFAFGPDPYANKAGLEDTKEKTDSEIQKEPPKLVSYGSATCDGLRALAYLGVNKDDEGPAKAAELWLIRHDTVESVPGFPSKTDRNWQQSLYFYYTMSLAKAYRLYPQTGTLTRRRRLADHVIKLQQPNGSWVNSAGGMREDDPLIATAFALIAIAESMADAQ